MKKLFLLVIPLFVILGLYYFVSPKITKPEDKVIVYTYSSFASSWGAGAAIQKAYKEKHNFDVEFVDVGEAGTILQRLKMEGENTLADLVLGLDAFSLEKARELGFFEEHQQTFSSLQTYQHIEKYVDPFFMIFDWSPMALVYRKSDYSELPKSLIELTASKYKSHLVLYDPRSSTPGYIFVHYILDLMGVDKGKEFLRELKKNKPTITPSWSAGYGLFTQKNAKLAFSYLGSPVYHWVEEKNKDYQALKLQEPMPIHVEYAALLKDSNKKERVKEFLKFLLSKEVQKIIVDKNYMFPVREDIIPETVFLKLKIPDLYTFKENLSREEVLKVWNQLK